MIYIVFTIPTNKEKNRSNKSQDQVHPILQIKKQIPKKLPHPLHMLNCKRPHPLIGLLLSRNTILVLDFKDDFLFFVVDVLYALHVDRCEDFFCFVQGYFVWSDWDYVVGVVFGLVALCEQEAEVFYEFHVLEFTDFLIGILGDFLELLLHRLHIRSLRILLTGKNQIIPNPNLLIIFISHRLRNGKLVLLRRERERQLIRNHIQIDQPRRIDVLQYEREVMRYAEVDGTTEFFLLVDLHQGE